MKLPLPAFDRYPEKGFFGRTGDAAAVLTVAEQRGEPENPP